ncbi:MAG: TonB-dependent receptor [bacterium]
MRLAELIAASLLITASATAQTASRDSSRAHSLDTMKVSGRIDDLVGVARSASEGRVGAADLRLRPITREGELLETVPGMIVTQHSGEGKANQYFVRGFNLDHGTDFQTRLEGMPLNLPTHGHGQGYTDLNFLIPEFIDYVDYKLGVHHADVGDFGSAGAADFHLASKLAQPFASVTYGQNGLARLAAGRSSRIGGGDLLIGGEGKAYDGPWQLAERVRKFSGMARYTWGSIGSQFSVLALAYRNRWNSNDQIPLRAVEEGLIGRLGQLDTTDGGTTQRYSLSGSWRRIGTRSSQQLQLFGVYSDLTLFSNFTYFLDNPVQGDQFSQTDRRTIVGANATHTQQVDAFGVAHSLKIGLQTRFDIIDGVGLYHTENRVRFATVRQDDVRESGSGVFIEAESRWHPRFRTVLGARADAYSFDVSSDTPGNSGRRTAGIVSPKASLIYAPTQTSEIYVSGGLGFHSNDARGTTITVDPTNGERVSRVDPLVRSRGGELGLRLSPIEGLRSTMSLWMLHLDSELMFTGDAGITEPSAASRRRGVTFANFYRPVPSLSLDTDVSFAHAAFADGSKIPGALERVIAGGVTYGAPHAGAFSAVRVRHFGSYPLAEDNVLRGRASTLVNADAGYRLRSGTRLQVSVLNVFNERADDIQYAYASRLRGESSDGVDDVHFHPAEPRQVRVSVEWRP